MYRTSADELAKQHFPWADGIAARIAGRLPSSFEREDLIQEARLATWKKAREYDPSRGVPFESFAFRAVAGACYMTARRRGWRDSTHEELRDTHETPPDQEDAVHVRHIVILLKHSVDRLPPRERAVLLLYYFCGLPMKRVARRIDVRMTTAWGIKRAALELLREELRRLNVNESDLRAEGARWAN
jgi:RNA polymerase sigma factor (sigma-70 family)